MKEIYAHLYSMLIRLVTQVASLTRLLYCHKMQIIDFKIKVAEQRAELLRTRSNDALLSALDLLALVKRRIQSKGESSTGAAFSPYTKDYKKFREQRGAQTAYVDATLTGRLMANIQPMVESDTNEATTVSIAARSKENINKMLGFAKKRGNLLLPNKAEIDLLKKIYVQRRKKRINL